MAKLPRSYRLPLSLSVGLHVLLIAFLFVELPSHTYRMPGPLTHKKVVQAVAVNQKQVKAEIASIKRRERQKRQRQQARLRRIKAKARAARLARIKAQRRRARLKAQQKRLKQQRLARAKALARKKRLQAIAKKTAALQNKMLAQQLDSDQQQLTKVQARQMQGIVDRYKAEILQAIGQHWVIPPGADKTLSSIFLIQVAPGGVVLNVQLVRSSGNTALDQSAQVAINKASPLPVPKDPVVFDKFRELRLTVSPKEIVSG